MSSKPLSAAGGAIRGNRKSKATPKSLQTRAAPLVPAHDMDLAKVEWSKPRTINDSPVKMSFANYDGHQFRVLLDNIRIVTSPTEFQPPKGKAKHSFGVSLGNDNADGAALILFLNAATGVENHSELAELLKTHGPLDDEGIKVPLWGDDATALTLTFEPEKLHVIDGTLDDIVAGATIKVAASAAMWFNVEPEDGGKMKGGVRLKAESVRVLAKKDASEIDWNAYTPARQLGRHVRIGARGRLPIEIVLRIVKFNTSLSEAVHFFKMGFPLRECMHGVGWPQNRYEAPAALFRPDPVLVEGCYACGYTRRLCRCPMLLRQLAPTALPLEGAEDEEGIVWPYYTQSIEDGYNRETYLVQHWSDESMEWSIAHALNGERVAHQLKSVRIDRLRQWRSADPLCTCFWEQGDAHMVPTHDAWEECPNWEMDI